MKGNQSRSLTRFQLPTLSGILILLIEVHFCAHLIIIDPQFVVVGEIVVDCFGELEVDFEEDDFDFDWRLEGHLLDSSSEEVDCCQDSKEEEEEEEGCLLDRVSRCM